MDDCNPGDLFDREAGDGVQIPLWTIVTMNYLPKYCMAYPVQIPLWTIVTQYCPKPDVMEFSSDSSMDDCNGFLLVLIFMQVIKVQIPLWTIVTKRLTGGWRQYGSSDSSMDDCNAPPPGITNPANRCSDSSMDDCNVSSA